MVDGTGDTDPGLRVGAIISDFGGVLTSPLHGAFQAFQDTSGVPLAELGTAMAALGARLGVNPLFELETGRLTEAEFLSQIGVQLSEQLGRTIDMEGFGERYFAHLEPNEPMIGYMRELRERGLQAGDLHQQRARVGAPLAGDVAGGGDLRCRRGLRLRGHPQARAADL